VLQERTVRPIGSSKEIKVDFRLVAATNRDLHEMVKKGDFRQDLYYRLNTVPIYVPALRERGSDIELLFRKFAVDFAEKYKVQPLTLTEDAKVSLTKYRFPGNIRQLKNLVEQMSVLEIKREINNETVLKYLPTESSYLPALYRQQPEHEKSGMSERELLYKILFDMRKDVNDLKKLVHGLLNDDVVESSSISERNQDIFSSTPPEKEPASSKDLPSSPYILDTSRKTTYDFDNIEDITHETEGDESLSIEAKEKELIIKALRKNNNKRKYAAKDLGISERTLYRKIKQFEIDE
jgi:transcriptional regulator with PAS, ATPase and Fis domain